MSCHLLASCLKLENTHLASEGSRAGASRQQLLQLSLIVLDTCQSSGTPQIYSVNCLHGRRITFIFTRHKQKRNYLRRPDNLQKYSDFIFSGHFSSHCTAKDLGLFLKQWPQYDSTTHYNLNKNIWWDYNLSDSFNKN